MTPVRIPALSLRDVRKSLPGDSAGRVGTRRDPRRHARRARRHRRPVGLGQEHAAAPGRRPRAAHRGHGQHRGAGPVRARRPCARRAARLAGRRHLPAVLPARFAHRAGQRGHRPAVPRHAGQAQAGDRRRDARPGRSRPAENAPAAPAVRGRAAASRHRQGPGGQPGHRARRRADGQPRPVHRPGDHDPAAHAQRRARRHPGHHHARHGDRGGGAAPRSSCGTAASSPTAPAIIRKDGRAHDTARGPDRHDAPGRALHSPGRRHAAHRRGRLAAPAHPRCAVRARHRHRHRGARRGARHHPLQPVRAARRDRPARHEPAHRDQRADASAARRPSCQPPPPR